MQWNSYTKGLRLSLAATLGLGLTLALLWLLGGAHIPFVQADSLARPLFAPAPTGTVPGSNALNVPITSNVSITFDEPISLTSVTSRTFAVYGSQSPIFTGTYSLSNLSRTVALDPVRGFFPGERIEAIATTATLNITGEQAISATVWQFWAAVGGGSGRFGESGHNVGSSTRWTGDIALGDVDDDGDLDLTIGSRGQQNVIHANDGNGSFDTVLYTFPLGDATQSVALGDVDNDGDLDLAIGNESQQNVVYLNDGDGTFDTTSYNVGPSDDATQSVALGDVDGDGDLDLAVGNFSEQNVIYFNDGDGTFDTISSTVGPGNDNTWPVALGDVDGDGDLDLAVGNRNFQNIVYLNDGDGTFDTTSYNFGTGSDTTNNLTLGDVDGDGDLDLAVGNEENQNVVYLNDGDGTFDTTSYNFGTGNDETYDLTMGDVDDDADLDLAVGNFGPFTGEGEQNIVYLNDGDGTFDTITYTVGLTNSTTTGLALGDVDGDGDLDLAVGNYFGNNTVYLGLDRADLALAKTVSPGTAVPGEIITYTLVYTNHGPQVATGVLITDVVPISVTNISYAYTGAVVIPTGSVSYTWQVADLAKDEGGVITITGVLTTGLPAGYVFTNTATITGTTVDDDTTNNSSPVGVIVGNAPPVAVDDPTNSTDENTPMTIDVLDNDSDPNGDPLSISEVGTPNYGSAAISGSDVVYTPTNRAASYDVVFTYTVSDGSLSDIATVTVTVTADNDPPIAADDTDATNEDTPVTIDVLGNDGDPDTDDTLSISEVGTPNYGSAAISGSDVVYTPTNRAASYDAVFTYTVSDGSLSDVATVTVTVTADDDPPVAVDDTDTTNEDTPVTIDVLGNDGDPEGLPLSISEVGTPNYGSAAISGSDVVYTPTNRAASYDAVFTYTVSDGSLSDVATVTVTVTADDDPPVAVDDTDATNEDTPVTIDVLGNDGDPEGLPLSISEVGTPNYGSAAISGSDVVYTPTNRAASYDAVFTYTVSDGSLSDVATVTVTVTADNDPPIAVDDTDATNEDTPVTIDVLGNDGDPDTDDTLSISEVGTPNYGSAAISGSDVVYTPTNRAASYDAVFTYTVSDGSLSDVATVTVTVTADNDPPIAVDDTDATNEDTPVTIDVLGNDGDPEGLPLSISEVGTPNYGSAAISGSDVVYTPTNRAASYDAVFTYTVSDGSLSDVATVTVTVTADNDPPVAVDDTDATNEDTPVTIDVLGNDGDPDTDDTLSISEVGTPNYGSAAISGSDVVYTPTNRTASYDAVFTYTVSDGSLGDVATVTVTVTADNDPPVAVDDTDATNEDTPVTIDVLGNDGDPEGLPLSISEVGTPNYGSAAISGSDVVYTPTNRAASYDAVFTYTVSDGSLSDVATVTVTVTADNDPPIAVDDTDATNEDTPVTIDVLGNDGDPDTDDTLSISEVGTPNYGSAAISGSDVVYTPTNRTASYDAVFTYTVSDGSLSDVATVTVTVTADNDPPAFTSTPVEDATENVSYTYAIIATDVDAGDVLTITAPTRPTWLTLVDNGDGTATLSGTPTIAHVGDHPVELQVRDIGGLTDTQSFTITVAPTHADLEMNKAVDNETPDEGGTIVYTLQVTNNGPVDVTGVVISDTLPVGVTYVSDDGDYDDGTGVWNVGTLDVSASATLRITATVDAGTAGTTVTNTAVISSSSLPDPDSGNDEADAVIVVNRFKVYVPIVLRNHQILALSSRSISNFSR